VVQLAEVAHCLFTDLAPRVVRRVPRALQLPQRVVRRALRVQLRQQPVQFQQRIPQARQPGGVERAARPVARTMPMSIASIIRAVSLIW
jgi:hypothetical protein